MDIPLPDPDRKKGKNNNRKQTFDAECRKMLFRICAKHNLHLQMEPTYGGRGYMEKQDFIIEKQKETISVQREILTETSQAIEEREKKIGKAEKAIAEKEKLIKKHDEVIAEKKQELSQKQAALEDVTMKLADMETLVDEVAGQAYEKACEVVADTVRQETQKEDIKILDDYSKWLSAPERTDDKKLRDYAVRRLGVLKDKLLKSAKGIVEKVAKALQEPERKKENLEQVREKARISLKAQLSANKKHVDDYKSQHYGTNMKQAGKDEQSL